ncbi:MAG: hypothetical protein ACJ8H8_01000 [Geminicoccaceae bacterium]
MILAVAAAAQEVPRALFPPPQPVPEAVTPPSPATAIKVEDLTPPESTALGLADAEADLGGPLWAKGAPPDLPGLLARLPASITEPTLAGLQRSLLAAPMPTDSGADALFLLRLDRLLAMGEAATTLQLLAQVPEGTKGPELEARRLQARFAAGQVEPACAAANAPMVADAPWPEARIVCAALAGDMPSVELGLDLLDSGDAAPAPVLAGLARAAVAGGRFSLPAPVPHDPLLLPLLRSVPLDLDEAALASLSVPARRTIAENAGVAAASRAAVLMRRAGPSVRPELNGTAPADWMGAMAGVSLEKATHWLALADGLGLDVPEPVWRELARSAPPDSDPPPDLLLWRGFERARLQDQRGGMLLYTLLLLNGRPEAVAPVTLRRALDALLALGLERDARALAAGTGGALGL